MTFNNNNTFRRSRSDLWYVLPIFGGIVGGLISWFAIKYDEPKKARNCLFLGIILTAIPIIMMIVFFILFSTTEVSVTPFDPSQAPIRFIDKFYF